MDVQHGILDRIPDGNGYLARVSATVEAARRKAIPVRFVVVGFRPGMPEVSARNRAFSSYKQQTSPFLGIRDRPSPLKRRRGDHQATRERLHRQ